MSDVHFNLGRLDTCILRAGRQRDEMEYGHVKMRSENNQVSPSEVPEHPVSPDVVVFTGRDSQALEQNGAYDLEPPPSNTETNFLMG